MSDAEVGGRNYQSETCGFRSFKAFFLPKHAPRSGGGRNCETLSACVTLEYSTSFNISVVVFVSGKVHPGRCDVRGGSCRDVSPVLRAALLISRMDMYPRGCALRKRCAEVRQLGRTLNHWLF